ncbi:hypothetical protein GCM10020229_06540 [Kitasatospora albolonga]
MLVPEGLAKSGDDVERPGTPALGPQAADGGGQRGRVALRHGDGGHVQQPGRAGHADVAGRADQQHVVRCGAERAQHQQHALLRADGDHHRGRVDGQALVVGEGAGDQVGDDALGGAVLEQRGADLVLRQAAAAQVVQVDVEVLRDLFGLEEALRAGGRGRRRGRRGSAR